MLAIQAVLSRQEKSAYRYVRRTHKLQQSEMDENGGKCDLQKKKAIIHLLVTAVSLLCVYLAKQDKIKSSIFFHASQSINSWPEKVSQKLDEGFLKISVLPVRNYYQGFTIVSFISEKATK